MAAERSERVDHPCSWCPRSHNARLVAFAEMLEEVDGPLIGIPCAWGVWRVPRSYVALHGIEVTDLLMLAMRFGWEKA